jgi:CRISPR/Cas system-associated endonuclease/helicase Cas3
MIDKVSKTFNIYFIIMSATLPDLNKLVQKENKEVEQLYLEKNTAECKALIFSC